MGGSSPLRVCSRPRQQLAEDGRTIEIDVDWNWWLMVNSIINVSSGCHLRPLCSLSLRELATLLSAGGDHQLLQLHTQQVRDCQTQRRVGASWRWRKVPAHAQWAGGWLHVAPHVSWRGRAIKIFLTATWRSRTTASSLINWCLILYNVFFLSHVSEINKTCKGHYCSMKQK